MRVLLAGLFVFVVVLISACLILKAFPQSGAPGVSAIAIGIALAIIFVISIPASLVVFNLCSRTKVHIDSLEDLQKQGLVESRTYEAKRALQIEEFEDEGLQFFMELKDGSVLFLAGQYLYDYSPALQKENGHRAFPCKKFQLLRHKTTHVVLDLIPEGTAFEPEFEAPPFNEKDFEQNSVPEDGEVLTKISYDEIKQKHLKRVAARET